MPLEIDHMITDTLLCVQSNLIIYSTVQEAVEAAADIERKFRSKIGASEEDGGDESDDDDDGPLNGGHDEDGEEEEDEEEDEEVSESCDCW